MDNNDKQMSFLFEEGGLTDDGTNVDPVSGNEVPPGSMAEEVRDDVPAQLSEGEYVVPADVVRFFGVRFFEELRSQAKQGLGDMEANGRIGGEPVAQTMDNQTGGELTPEELAALEQVTGMAMGGMVQPQAPNPYLQQQQLMTQPQQPQQQNPNVVYAADGADISAAQERFNTDINPFEPQFTMDDASKFAPGFLADQVTGTTGSRTVTLYSPDGIAVTFTLPAEQAVYDQAIKDGYTEEPIAVVSEAGTATSRSDDDDGPRAPAPQQGEDTSKIDLTADTDTLIKQAKSLSLLRTAATAVSSVFGGVGASTLINTGLVAQYNDIVDELDNRGENKDGLERKGSIFGGESSLYEGLQDVDGNGKRDFGDTWLGDLLGFDKDGVGVNNAGLQESRLGARRDTTSTSTPTPTTTSSSSSDRDRSTPAAPSTSPRPPQRPTPAADTVDTSGGGSTNTSTIGTEVSDSYKKLDKEDDDYAMLNKGGMVKRRKSKKKK